MKQRTPSEVIVAAAPFGVEVQRMVVERYPHLRPHLARNPALSKEVWLDLYGERTSVETAERLLWRVLDEEQVEHALVTRSESRKQPLTALLRSGSTVPARHLETAARSASRQTADLLLTFRGLPETARLEAAKRASFKNAALWALRDHRSFSDDDLFDVLSGTAGSDAYPYRHHWAVLVGVMIDRPLVRDRLARVAPGAALVWAVSQAGISGNAQIPFLTRILDREATPFLSDARRTSALEEVYLHPATTPRARRWILAKVGVDPAARVSLRTLSPPLVSGDDLTTTSDPGALEACLSLLDAPTHSTPVSKAWPLVALSTNPLLSQEDRSRVVAALENRSVASRLANCAVPALERARTGRGDLVPATPWRLGSKVGDYDTLYNRLGPVVGRSTRSYVSGWGGEVKVRRVGVYNQEDDMEVGTYLSEELGENVEAWQILLGLVDEFDGQVSEVADAALSLAR